MLRLAAFGIFFAFGLWYANEFIKFADIHKVIYNQQPGICHEVAGVYAPEIGEQGSEDVEVLPNGMAIFSSGLNYMRNPVLSHVKGRLMSFNFNQSAEPAKELRLLGFKGLNPHGISLWTETGRVSKRTVKQSD
ncbi:hypothetical protein BV898_13956 [Hypsibius exemplaris]|uniref:Uncharacterized protein n=1 Tax=Hypsibius exemplaris TaxID=2072580 RepID=A0A1W0W977_HYPEX|nr:hypothetical protein BV898_13956 [Hypsibius exemplaris]